MALNYTELKETFDKAIFLLEEESKNDPETEPYKSKYAAKDLFSTLKTLLKKHQDLDENDEATSKPKYLMGILEFYIGYICVDTLEVSTGEEHLLKCLEIFQDKELQPEYIITVLSALNQLGLMWSKRMDFQKSREFLLKVEKIHGKYLRDCGGPPFAPEDLFVDSVSAEKLESNFKKLDSLVTHAHYYLAQVYNALEDAQKAAAYCHSTLRRELESKEYDPMEWSLNSAVLSQFFTNHKKFHKARHHLSCAAHIMKQFEAGLQSTENHTEEAENKWEVLKQKKADIARCWVKYALILLYSSKENLMNEAEEEAVPDDELVEPARDENEENDNFVMEELEMSFSSLEVTEIEDQITADLVLDFAQARKVFLTAQKWLNVAKEYYTLEEHASEHIKLVQDLSNLYKLLVFFEPNSERQCKMQKRRIDILETVLKELNPQYYIIICRQLKLELGEIYCELLDTKGAMMRESDGQVSSHAVQKINHLAKQSISYFNSFLDTFLNPSGKMPEKFDDDTVIRSILMAHFYIGRLYSKIMVSDVKKELEYLKQSQEYFQKIVNYCKEDELAAVVMKEELGVCEEMVRLLPVKMEKMLSAA